MVTVYYVMVTLYHAQSSLVNQSPIDKNKINCEKEEVGLMFPSNTSLVFDQYEGNKNHSRGNDNSKTIEHIHSSKEQMHMNEKLKQNAQSFNSSKKSVNIPIKEESVIKTKQTRVQKAYAVIKKQPMRRKYPIRKPRIIINNGKFKRFDLKGYLKVKIYDFVKYFKNLTS